MKWPDTSRSLHEHEADFYVEALKLLLSGMCRHGHFPELEGQYDSTARVMPAAGTVFSHQWCAAYEDACAVLWQNNLVADSDGYFETRVGISDVTPALIANDAKTVRDLCEVLWAIHRIEYQSEYEVADFYPFEDQCRFQSAGVQAGILHFAELDEYRQALLRGKTGRSNGDALTGFHFWTPALVEGLCGWDDIEHLVEPSFLYTDYDSDFQLINRYGTGDLLQARKNADAKELASAQDVYDACLSEYLAGLGLLS